MREPFALYKGRNRIRIIFRSRSSNNMMRLRNTKNHVPNSSLIVLPVHFPIIDQIAILQQSSDESKANDTNHIQNWVAYKRQAFKKSTYCDIWIISNTYFRSIFTRRLVHAVSPWLSVTEPHGAAAFSWISRLRNLWPQHKLIRMMNLANLCIIYA
jgi:hypothetical protein